MYEYFQGKIKELNPSFVVLDIGGIGYFINISLFTYTHFSGTTSDQNDQLIYVHQIVREDALLLYGFANPKEREIFRQLLSVSGVGANTARLILSSMSPDEIIQSVRTENVNALKSVKGIGAKSAQRIIVDLKDKIGFEESQEIDEIVPHDYNTIRNEALSAMITLGFSKRQSETVIEKVLKEIPEASVEDLVKNALKRL